MNPVLILTQIRFRPIAGLTGYAGNRRTNPVEKPAENESVASKKEVRPAGQLP
jgi:hypothetical protein